jgi:hypothetical protein
MQVFTARCHQIDVFISEQALNSGVSVAERYCLQALPLEIG